MKWDFYFLAKNTELQDFWIERLNHGERKVLFILALGFDPRMCDGLSMLMKVGGRGRRDAVLIEFDEGPDSPSHALRPQIEANREKLGDLLQGKGEIQPRQVTVLDADDRRVESVSAAQLFSNILDFTPYDEVVFDISALPRGIYFPIIAKLLYLREEARRAKNKEHLPNIHVLVAENAELDGLITQAGIEESAQFVHGFSGGAQQEASASVPCIWMPLLGES
jgi:hypothetical protein